METENFTRVSMFILLGLSDDPELQPPLFGVFLFMYVVTVLGNLFIILAVNFDSRLHSPMYFFLANLSLADIGFTSTTVPKILYDIHTHLKFISYVGCLIQVSFFYLFGCMDSLLLSAMAYDRFVAICHPLHYSVIMNPRLCRLLLLAAVLSSLLLCLLHLLVVSLLSFCTEVEIPSFFCDVAQLINIACSDTHTTIISMYFIGAVFGGVPASWILWSYTQIVASILRVPSAGGKYKAFSTCSSHLSVVCLFYGTSIGVYISSVVARSHKSGAVVSVIYTIVTPMLNPFIYSLRNRDLKKAVHRLLSKTSYFK
ncbi:olfactory receptor 7E178-like [Tenrec ecaudatus]|uniref:olfactory receptor 7E178-like n=1 Tax=Tenrec ecaudatus TaxID=94439 RepID=UPI003F598F49